MNTAKLRAIAEAATPFDFGKDEQGFVRDCDRIELQYYIATFHPARVKALLDCVEALQAVINADDSQSLEQADIESGRAALKALEAA